MKSGDKIYSSLIIGVDGANSKIRKIQNIKTKDHGIKKFGLVTIMEHETSHPNVSWQVFSETGILALLAKDIKPNKRAVSSLIWSLDKKQIDAIRNLTSKDFEKKVKEEFGSSLGDLHLISKINEWPIFRIDVPNPTGTRTVLLGDAAHSIYPLAGQGFNLAIGDILQITDTMLWAKERGLDFVVVDYMQLIYGGRGANENNRAQEVSRISRALKGMARDLNVPVIAISQLSRSIEQRQSHRPVLSDLRESGSIEQDADIVMFIHREEKYISEEEWLRSKSIEEEYPRGLSELIIAKHRNGPIGNVNLVVQDQFARFMSANRQ